MSLMKHYRIWLQEEWCENNNIHPGSHVYINSSDTGVVTTVLPDGIIVESIDGTQHTYNHQNLQPYVAPYITYTVTLPPDSYPIAPGTPVLVRNWETAQWELGSFIYSFEGGRILARTDLVRSWGMWVLYAGNEELLGTD